MNTDDVVAAVICGVAGLLGVFLVFTLVMSIHQGITNPCVEKGDPYPVTTYIMSGNVMIPIVEQRRDCIRREND